MTQFPRKKNNAKGTWNSLCYHFKKKQDYYFKIKNQQKIL